MSPACVLLAGTHRFCCSRWHCGCTFCCHTGAAWRACHLFLVAGYQAQSDTSVQPCSRPQHCCSHGKGGRCRWDGIPSARLSSRPFYFPSSFKKKKKEEVYYFNLFKVGISLAFSTFSALCNITVLPSSGTFSAAQT